VTALNKGPSGNLSFSAYSVIRCTVVALVISILGAAVLGLIFYFSSFSEQVMPFGALGILFVSVFAGGTYAAKRAGNSGIYHGLAVGIGFFAVSWFLVTLFFPGSTAFFEVIQKLVVTCIAGGIGGVLGVGLKP